MNQTDKQQENSERIRKIYVKDLKVGETVTTVFRALGKEKHTSRGGKPYLTLVLVDRTGDVEGRVFENVPAADGAFSNDDYLLVRGKIGQFHGRTQLVIDQLDRLDPGPIDAAEFAWNPPPPKPKEEKAGRDDSAHAAKVKLTKRLERLLEHPHLVQALDNFVAHLEKAIHAAAGTPPPARNEKPERRAKGPKVEHKAPAPHAGEGHETPPPKAEAKRDPTLPEGLAFKPFSALMGSEEPGPSDAAPTSTEAPATPAPADAQ